MKAKDQIDSYLRQQSELQTEYLHSLASSDQALQSLIKLLFAASGGAIIALITIIASNVSMASKLPFLTILGEAVQNYFASILFSILSVLLLVIKKENQTSVIGAAKAVMADSAEELVKKINLVERLTAHQNLMNQEPTKSNLKKNDEMLSEIKRHEEEQIEADKMFKSRQKNIKWSASVRDLITPFIFASIILSGWFFFTASRDLTRNLFKPEVFQAAQEKQANISPKVSKLSFQNKI